MLQVLIIFFGALVLLILYKALSVFIADRRHASNSKKLGCEALPQYLAQDITGISATREAIAAGKDKRIPDLLIDRVLRMSTREGRRVDTFVVQQLFRPTIFTADPKNIQAVLATQFQDFGLGAIRRTNFFPLLGNGIFAADGQRWEHARALLRPSFVRDQVADIDLVERHVQNLMQALPFTSDGWTEEVNIQTLFFRLTIDSATEFLFGESVDSQLASLREAGDEKSGGPLHDELAFAAAFDRSQQWLSYRGRFGKYGWMINPKDFQRCNQQCHAFVDRFVRLTLNDTSKERSVLRKGEKKARYVFFDALTKQSRDPIEIRDQLLNILLAGRDTTASLLSWLFHLLVRDQSSMRKLRTEILASFGSYDSSHNLSFEGLKACAYLQWCLSEALRLWPVVPVNSRMATRDTSLPRGGGSDGSSPVYVRKGQSVFYSVHVVHRRPDLWGPDYHQFVPERWRGRRSGWEYLPFNGGPRICLGQQLALMEAGYVAVRLLQRFETVEAGSREVLTGSPRQSLGLTSCPNDGVWLKLKEASK